MASSIFVRPLRPPADRRLPIAERVLRDRLGVWQQISRHERLDALIAEQLRSATLSLAIYGAVLGLSHGPWQALASAIKLPLLFLLTLAICLPTLYLFNLLCGGRLTAQQSLAFVLVAITSSATLLLPWTPVALFVLLTAPNYHLYILLNVAFLALCSVVGLLLLIDGTLYLNAAPRDHDPETPARPTANITLLQCWLLLYGLVGTQLGWTLRPFFGDPALPFQMFHTIEGHFVGGVFDALVRVLGEGAVR
jgi:hypothetical protein